jgi:hypothetical protein
MKRFFLLIIIVYFHTWMISGQTGSSQLTEPELQTIKLSAQKYIKSLNSYSIDNYQGRGKVRMNSLNADKSQKKIHIFLNKFIGEAPLRPSLVKKYQQMFSALLPPAFKNYGILIYADSIPLSDLIPNYYREKKLELDSVRIFPVEHLRPERKNPVYITKPYEITNGLMNSNIALWASHGWYYESSLDRWEWQRARLFTTVEDLLPASIVVPYLMPMLRNSGAFVFTPRESDMQVNEVIIDNDFPSDMVKYPGFLMKSERMNGFANLKTIRENQNPFRNGTYLYGVASSTDSLVWIPDIPETGEYQVYISYGIIENASKLKYRVYYPGHYCDYVVDQSKGQGTWMPLGKHFFHKGKDKAKGSLVLYFEKGQNISIDAVRFGGGMGNVERNGLISGKSRFMEAPRYYLQYSGFPDTLTWKTNGENMDYTDNFRCQGDWVNYLVGKPFGPGRDTSAGMGFSMDLSFAFHTDAGVPGGDSVMGTLAIYSTSKDSGFFADGQSRLASRDLSDLVQSQIVDDIRVLHHKKWTRRGLWNSDYSEAYKPNVPSMLLELLSHQNPNEMRLALDPTFRFDVSRAIYKGMLRFISFQHGYEYCVQPLPVAHFKIEMTEFGKLRLSWKPVEDPLEPTAKPEQFVVYTRKGNAGFDAGKLVQANEFFIDHLEPNIVYSFKIAAVNRGGESFPSEILSAGITNKEQKPVLIVNGFDRLEAPYYFETDSFSGFVRQLDQGVQYLYDFHTTGDQYDFSPKSPWLDDDAPGFGASYANEENIIYPGNTFDYPAMHGEALLTNGFSFLSTSDEAFESETPPPANYLMVDFVYGEEKTSGGNKFNPGGKYKIYTPQLLKNLEILVNAKIPVFISGSYIGTEIGTNSALEKKIGELLGFKFRTNYAVKSGPFYLAERNEHFKREFDFVTAYHKDIYAAEAPDAIEPYSAKSQVLFRYGENNTSAGVYTTGPAPALALGFPFECIPDKKQRNEIMKIIIEKLLK